MKVSAKIDYACRALLELGLHWPHQRPLQVSDIAKQQKIPMNFLIHILITLKQLGYVDSVRGKKGGYILVKTPKDVRLSEIIRAFGGFGFSPADSRKKDRSTHVMDVIWQEVDHAVLKVMEVITLDIICNRHLSKQKTISYEI